MAHRFHKRASTSGLPSRTASTMWDKMKKYAHGVWKIEDEGGRPIAHRLRPETAKLEASEEVQDQFSPGDVILLFMGGRQLQASVFDVDNDMLIVTSKQGHYRVPSTWARPFIASKQAQVAPSAPQRTQTREDVPVYQPPQLDGAMGQVAESISGLLESRGGKIGLRLSPSTVMVVESHAGGVSARMYNVSTQLAHSGNYGSVEQLVQSLNLNTYPEAVDPSQVESGV